MLSKGSTATCFCAKGRTTARRRFRVEGIRKSAVLAKSATRRTPPTHGTQARDLRGPVSQDGREASSSGRRDEFDNFVERDAAGEAVVASSSRIGSTASRS